MLREPLSMRLRGGVEASPPSDAFFEGIASLKDKVMAEFEEKGGNIEAGLDEDFDDGQVHPFRSVAPAVGSERCSWQMYTSGYESEDYNETLKRITEKIGIKEGLPKTRLPTLEELENKGMMESELDPDAEIISFDKDAFGAYWVGRLST